MGKSKRASHEGRGVTDLRENSLKKFCVLFARSCCCCSASAGKSKRASHEGRGVTDLRENSLRKFRVLFARSCCCCSASAGKSKRASHEGRGVTVFGRLKSELSEFQTKRASQDDCPLTQVVLAFDVTPEKQSLMFSSCSKKI